MTLTVPVAERIRELHRGGLPLPDIAASTGVKVRTVNEVVRGLRYGRPLNPRDQAEEDERTGWAPLCLTADEWADWRALNPIHVDGAVARPCGDCPMGFAADMRAAGRCNGEPRWSPPEPDEDPAPAPAQETPMPILSTTAELDLSARPPVTGMPLEGLHGTARALAIAATVDLHGGDRTAAAKDLGIRTQEVGMALARYGLAPKAEAPRASKNLPGSKAAPATERPRSGPSAPEPVEVAPESTPEPEATVAPRMSDTEMVRGLLRMAHDDAREMVADLATATAIDPRFRRLLKAAKAVKRDLAEAWADQPW